MANLCKFCYEQILNYSTPSSSPTTWIQEWENAFWRRGWNGGCLSWRLEVSSSRTKFSQNFKRLKFIWDLQMVLGYVPGFSDGMDLSSSSSGTYVLSSQIGSCGNENHFCLRWRWTYSDIHYRDSLALITSHQRPFVDRGRERCWWKNPKGPEQRNWKMQEWKLNDASSYFPRLGKTKTSYI